MRECGALAAFRFTRPGGKEIFACDQHAMQESRRLRLIELSVHTELLPLGHPAKCQHDLDAAEVERTPAVDLCGRGADGVTEITRRPDPALPPPPSASDRLDGMRARGWVVAVHNDYHQRGEFATFWLLTHPSGRYVKGEGRSDGEALAECWRQIERFSLEGPSWPYSVRKSETPAGNGWLDMGFNTYDDAVKFWAWVERLVPPR